jgi:hypothetical protein
LAPIGYAKAGRRTDAGMTHAVSDAAETFNRAAVTDGRDFNRPRQATKQRRHL